jgi:LacI family transcriptional regulator
VLRISRSVWITYTETGGYEIFIPHIDIFSFIRGTLCFGLISSITSSYGVGYAGLDNWKVGRTAGWALNNICVKPGRLGIMVGSHRYRCQETNESGLRSYMRENAPSFELLEPMITFEDRHVAAELTRDLLRREPDIAGIFISGGGLTGVIDVLRESGRSKDIVAVGYELTTETRSALIDGTLNLVISHPVDKLATILVDAMASAVTSGQTSAILPSINIPFEIYTPENI